MKANLQTHDSREKGTEDETVGRGLQDSIGDHEEGNLAKHELEH